ncbi:MAG: hypothetical protein ABIN48_11760, partial [Ginsengibacter sp.]
RSARFSLPSPLDCYNERLAVKLQIEECFVFLRLTTQGSLLTIFLVFMNTSYCARFSLPPARPPKLIAKGVNG